MNKTPKIKPPKVVAKRAERGLALRRKHKRGGTAVGIARARDLKNQRNLSEETLNRMVSYFQRHEIDKEAENFGSDENSSNGYIAWLLWGSDEGWKWAERKQKEFS